MSNPEYTNYGTFRIGEIIGEVDFAALADQYDITARVGGTTDSAPTVGHCPRCDSHSPNLHPAVQHGGEVIGCDDPFHGDYRPREGESLRDFSRRAYGSKPTPPSSVDPVDCPCIPVAGAGHDDPACPQYVPLSPRSGPEQESTAMTHSITRYRDRKVHELREGDIFSLDGGENYYTFVTRLSDQTVQIAEGPDCGGGDLLDATPDQVCLVQTVAVKIRIEFTMEVDVGAWSLEYGTERTAAAVDADARRYFDPPSQLIPEHLTEIVTVQ